MIPSVSWGVVFHNPGVKEIPNSHPHLLMVYPVLTIEDMTTESQRYNCFTRNGGNAIPKLVGPEAKGSNPTAGRTLLWARNPFRGHFNHWQVSVASLQYCYVRHPLCEV